MDPGTYITNTMLINAITSIPYLYLEPIQSSRKVPLASLRTIEYTWREKGALVVCDFSTLGIWLFGSGNGDDLDAKLSTLAKVDREGAVELHGFDFLAESRGTFDTAALKSPDVFHFQGSAKMTPISMEGIRNAQLLNARAAQLNGAASMKHENLPSPVNTGSSPEASDNAVKMLQLFISAVLGSASYSLCRDTGLIPLNSRTFTSPHRRSVSCVCPRFTAPMITLDVALTALGSLTLRATCQASSALTPVTILSGDEVMKTNVNVGELIWLAPGGLMARYLGPCTEELCGDEKLSSELGQNASSVQIKNWKHHSRMWLAQMGMDSSLLDDCTWLMVQTASPTFADATSNDTHDAGPSFPWPSDLSFIRQKIGFRTIEMVKNVATNRNTGMDGDPLTFAAQWFSAAAERESDVIRRQQNRDAESVLKAQAETQARIAGSYTYSPIAARRNSAAGGVYPTPPDGVQPMSGVTPNFDGTSTPGNANQSTPMNADSSAPVKDDHPSDLWESSGVRKARQGLEYATNDEGGIFGDMTNDIFGENDITDADFSFFDEPDRMLKGSVDNEMQQLSVNNEFNFEVNMSSGLNADTIMPDADLVINLPHNDTLPASHTEKNFSHQPGQSQPPSITFLEKPDIVAALSPELVFRRLFPAKSSLSFESNVSSKHRRISHFGEIGFESGISTVNSKYCSNGRFGYVETNEVTQQPLSKSIPETEYLRKHRRKAPPKSIATTWPPPSALMTLKTLSIIEGSEDLNEDTVPNSETASELSDPDDISVVSEELQVGMFVPGVKRKRDRKDEGDFETTSSSQELPAEPPPSIDTQESIPPPLNSDPADWPLEEFFNLPQAPISAGLGLSDTEYMAAAQILTDQVASSTIPRFSLLLDNSKTSTWNETTIVSKVQRNLAAVAKKWFHDVETCTFQKFLSIQGSVSQTIRTKGQNSMVHSQGDNPFSIKTPHVEVRRSDSRLTVLPSAISFWENLGLGPCKGNKDISAICIFPAGEAMSDNAAIFLERMKCAYESAKLGSHEKIDLGTEQSLGPGLVSIDLPPVREDEVMNQQTLLCAIKSPCRSLGHALASLSAEERNLVVYFIFPEHEEILPLVCTGFHDLYETYKKSLLEARANVRNELVLQLIPQRFMTSSTSVVVPPPTEYTRLSLEVYDRCTDFQSPSCSPSILLEQALPKSIEFKVMADPSVSLLDENSCIHVAYAQSIDDRWISAAWTDNIGSEQLTASYCLGRKSHQISRAFSDIANEIWQTTVDIIAHKPINWRVMIAKSGVMDRTEIDHWIGLASNESGASVSLTLLSIKSHPSLQLLPQPVVLSPTTLLAQSGMLTTPISTPQPLSILSPDQTSTPARDLGNNASTPDATPTDAFPSDATLIDIIDQTWGSILSHRLNNSNSLLDNCPSLLSGYLIKRSGTRPEDTPILLEINIVGMSGEGSHNRNARAYEHLLREIMEMYRGLGTLARARGTADPARDARPWHAAAVEKAVKVLYGLM